LLLEGDCCVDDCAAEVKRESIFYFVCFSLGMRVLST
jgi:hypothetical protein